MDIRMPVMDGYTATRSIKNTPRGQTTAIIALTAGTFEEQRLGMFEAGCDDFISKPFHETDIFAALEKHLGVEFIYIDRASDTTELATSNGMVLTPDMLTQLPTDWIARMHDATERVSMSMMQGLIEEIQTEYPSVATSFSYLVDNFEFEHILALTAKDQHEG